MANRESAAEARQRRDNAKAEFLLLERLRVPYEASAYLTLLLMPDDDEDPALSKKLLREGMLRIATANGVDLKAP